MRRPRLILAVVALVVVAAGLSLLRPGALDLAAPSPVRAALIATAETPAERGIVTFAFGDWDALTSDTLATSASPWKLATAALALQAAGGDVAAASGMAVADIYRPFGFLWPAEFANWPDTLPPPELVSPLGLNTALAARTWPPIAATIGNIGCAACHASVTYDSDGAPQTGRVWLGMPNGSINLEAYTQRIFTAVRDHGQDDAALFTVLHALFPDTGRRESLTLRYAILPRLRAVVAERDAALGRLLPFRASLAGATNGLDSLRNRLGLIPAGTLVTESIFNSVPDLGSRLWRNKLLNSGTYAIPGIDHGATNRAGDVDAAHRAGLAGIIAYFTVPSMGVTEEVAESNIPDAIAVTDWMDVYHAQPFPGAVDRTLLPQGRDIYARACAECHGSYDDSLTTPELVAFPNWEGEIGTDPQRARLLTPEIAAAVNGGLFGAHIAARTVAGYTAPPLAGIWASAPYQHNGSVPTLWHLMRPDERPARFMVGGHRLDLNRVGIELDPPAGWQTWSIPAEVDTTAFGLSNAGHEIGFATLTEAEKAALLEYLKLL